MSVTLEERVAKLESEIALERILLTRVQQVEDDVKTLKESSKESIFAWLVPYIPSMKSLLIALIGAGVGATGTYVGTPEKVKEAKLDPPPITKDDKKQPITVRPAVEDKK